MWGCISLDGIYQPNFSVGYSTMKSDVVTHLAQWQYWWWFWFSFLWGFYYLTINRVIHDRFLKFKPKIYTSYRSHGKWGDFLACIVPAIWCLNILTNSSFILRLMEWQNESSLFNIRIRGRQWYWIYKFELRHLVDFVSVPRNVGRNHWIINFGNTHEVTDSYFHAIKLRNQNTWLKKYWRDYTLVALKNSKKHNYELNFDAYEFNINKGSYWWNSNLETSYSVVLNNAVTAINVNLSFIYPYDALNFKYNQQSSILSDKLYNPKLETFFNKNIFSRTITGNDLIALSNESFMFSFILKKKNEYIYANAKKVLFSDNQRYIKKVVSELQPILITKSVNTFYNAETSNLINIHFNKEKNFIKKIYNNNNFFTIKQKRYKLKNAVGLRTIYKKTDFGLRSAELKYSDRPFLAKHSFINQIEFESTRFYRMMKKNKKHSEIISVQLSRRLLRTKRTLILPAHVNLTLITNSYDVVHSWFLPSLGVKLDCVPGRSTHHSFYVDSTGFFYGQCAEICGRYHHHMPIRICMLPYEHFFVWWQHFGLPKVLNTLEKSKFENDYAFKSFDW